jgi:hypothetical protein
MTDSTPEITQQMITAATMALVRAQLDGSDAPRQVTAALEAALSVEHRMVNLRQLGYPGPNDGKWVGECKCHFMSEKMDTAAEALQQVDWHIGWENVGAAAE